MLAGSCFLIVAVVAGVLVGPAGLGLADVAGSVGARLPFESGGSPLSPVDETILWELRMPRVVLGCLVGGMLACAGAAYQGVFRNPLADPYLLGVAAGAGLGATLAVAYGPPGALGSELLPLAAFAGAGAAVGGALLLNRSVGAGGGPATLALAGIALASFFTAVQTFVLQQHSDTIDEVYGWILGRLATSGWDDVALLAPYVGVSAAIIVLHGRLLDVLSLGDDEATSLGVNVRRVRLLVVAAATVGTAAAVSISGLIGFVGLIVPHAVRLLAGASYRTVVLLSLPCGAGFLVLTDVLARTALAPGEVPIGVVTAFLGAPFFAAILRGSRELAR